MSRRLTILICHFSCKAHVTIIEQKGIFLENQKPRPWVVVTKEITDMCDEVGANFWPGRNIYLGSKSYWTTLKCLGLLKKTEYGESEPLTRYIRRYVTDRDIFLL